MGTYGQAHTECAPARADEVAARRLAIRTEVRTCRLAMDLPLTAPRTGPAPADWVPVDACTLPTGDQPLRAAAFDDLFAASLVAVERFPGVDTRARLLLAGEERVREHVQCLVDAETACRAFFTFTVTPLHVGEESGAWTAVALDVEVPAAHAAVLTGLVARAQRARGAAA